MPALSHQQARYLFQLFWLAVFSALILTGAPSQVWIGLAGATLISTLLVKRAACSYVCPLFPLGEVLWRTGTKLFGRNLVVPFWFDFVLRSAKYLVLVWIVIKAGTELNSGPVLSVVPVIAALLVLSLFFQMPWCRYLCPAGALLGLTSMASLLKIRRSPSRCVRCHKCSHRCPANLPVMQRTTVRSPECFACYRCVDGCPAPGAPALATPGQRAVPAWMVGMVVSSVLIIGMLAGMIL